MPRGDFSSPKSTSILQWLSTVLSQIPEGSDMPLAVPLARQGNDSSIWSTLSIVQVGLMKVLRVFGRSLPAPTQRDAPHSCPHTEMRCIA